MTKTGNGASEDLIEREDIEPEKLIWIILITVTFFLIKE
jgi:hypothetical protein